MKRPRNRTLVIAAVVLVLAAAAAAFMLGRGNASAKTPSRQPFAQQGGGQAGNAGFQQFRQCMVKNGVTLSPGQRPNPTDPAVQKARQACAQYAPQRPAGGNGFGPPPAGGTTTTPGT